MRGKWVFVGCVVVDRLFQHSCVGWHYNALGKKCRFMPCKDYVLFMWKKLALIELNRI